MTGPSVIWTFVFAILLIATASASAQCVFNGQQWVYRYPNGLWGQCPIHLQPRPLLPYQGAAPPILPYQAAPPPILPYRAASVVNSEKVYDATCFNIKTGGNFFSKTIRELVASREAQLIGSAICTYYTGEAGACKKSAEMGADIANKLSRHSGSDSWGVIQLRPGYEVCRAFWDVSDWSVSSEATFNATIGPEPGTNITSVNYYVSMKVGDGKRRWVDTKVILEQVPIGTRERHGCWANQTLAWSCKGSSCAAEAPGARVRLAGQPGNNLCINHGRNN
jgi:hypothetical protein